MNLPEFKLPERVSVPPTEEQRTRLKRQIILAVKILAIVIVLWLVISLIASCTQMVSNMSTAQTSVEQSESVVTASSP